MWRLGLGTRLRKHLFGVRQACLGLIAAQHAGDLGGTRFAGYLVQMRLGNIARFLTDNIMLVGHDGDLRQVGYDNHLMRSGEICQHARVTRLNSPPDAMRRRGRGVKPAPLRYSSS